MGSEKGPFYWSRYDRFRLIELMFEKERKAAGLTHEKLAQRCDTPYVKAYHLTTIQNLTRTIKDPRHQLDRGRLLMAVSWGLQLPRWKVDLFLMLFDSTPLSEAEFQRFLLPYHQVSFSEQGNRSGDGTGSFQASCFRAMSELLTEWLWPSADPVSVGVSILDAKLGAYTARMEAMLQLEAQPGMRLIVKAEPSELTRPQA